MINFNLHPILGRLDVVAGRNSRLGGRWEGRSLGVEKADLQSWLPVNCSGKKIKLSQQLIPVENQG